MTPVPALIEDYVLKSPIVEVQETLIWLDDGSSAGLLDYFARHAGQRGGRPFGSHLEATRHLAIEVARFLRENWESRPAAQAYPDVPLAVRTIDEIPPLPKGLPVIFALTGAPRGDQLKELKRLSKARYTDSRTVLPATCPEIFLRLIRREGLATWTVWREESGHTSR